MALLQIYGLYIAPLLVLAICAGVYWGVYWYVKEPARPTHIYRQPPAE